MARLLLFGVLLLSFPALAQDKDDGFVWIDANTKIKLTPTSAPAGSAATGSTAPGKAPEKEGKKEKPPK
jgi:hypothetical protein